jgi:hypothetical protein|tara:strand:- start:319 stop:795 length:477 start_codon:yes stop_codon:yes gene_type:complete
MVDKFKMYVSKGGPQEDKPVVYEDRFPEGTTLEDLKEQQGTVIWCKYYACAHNKQFENTQRTTGALRNNTSYKPIVEKENVWVGLCTRDEIGVDFKSFFSSGAKFKVPACYNAATNKTDHMDFSKLIQSDGTPYGGNIDSQNPEHAAFHYGTAEYPDE